MAEIFAGAPINQVPQLYRGPNKQVSLYLVCRSIANYKKAVSWCALQWDYLVKELFRETGCKFEASLSNHLFVWLKFQAYCNCESGACSNHFLIFFGFIIFSNNIVCLAKYEFRIFPQTEFLSFHKYARPCQSRRWVLSFLLPPFLTKQYPNVINFNLTSRWNCWRGKIGKS